jgi:hypothetical protein
MDSTLFKKEDWNKLLQLGSIASFIIVCMIPFQMVIFGVWPPPNNASDFFVLFQKNWFLGLLSLDLLFILSNVLMIFVYLGLFAALRKSNPAILIVALSLAFIGMASYFSSTGAFEMLSLSNHYFQVDNDELLKQQYLSSGRTILNYYKGTSFDIYYVLNGIALLLITLIMLKDNTFTKRTAIWGLISAILMVIPSTAGAIGLIFSITSLIPWIVFSIMIASRMLKISKS